MGARLLWPLLFIVGLVFAAFALSSVKQPIDSGNPNTPPVIRPYAVVADIPDQTVTDKDGQPFKLEDLPSGTILTFWNSTCPECQTELKDFATYAEKNPSFKPVLVNSQEKVEDAKKTLESYDAIFTNYYDSSGEAFNAFVATLPATYYIKEGKITFFFPGRISAEHLQALLTQ